METPLLFRQFVGMMYYDSLVAKDRRSLNSLFSKP